MESYRPWSYSELLGNLLIATSFSNQLEHFPLTRRHNPFSNDVLATMQDYFITQARADIRLSSRHHPDCLAKTLRIGRFTQIAFGS